VVQGRLRVVVPSTLPELWGLRLRGPAGLTAAVGRCVVGMPHGRWQEGDWPQLPHPVASAPSPAPLPGLASHCWDLSNFDCSNRSVLNSSFCATEKESVSTLRTLSSLRGQAVQASRGGPTAVATSGIASVDIASVCATGGSGSTGSATKPKRGSANRSQSKSIIDTDADDKTVLRRSAHALATWSLRSKSGSGDDDAWMFAVPDGMSARRVSMIERRDSTSSRRLSFHPSSTVFVSASGGEDEVIDAGRQALSTYQAVEDLASTNITINAVKHVLAQFAAMQADNPQSFSKEYLEACNLYGTMVDNIRAIWSSTLHMTKQLEVELEENIRIGPQGVSDAFGDSDLQEGPPASKDAVAQGDDGDGDCVPVGTESALELEMHREKLASTLQTILHSLSSLNWEHIKLDFPRWVRNAQDSDIVIRDILEHMGDHMNEVLELLTVSCFSVEESLSTHLLVSTNSLECFYDKMQLKAQAYKAEAAEQAHGPAPLKQKRGSSGLADFLTLLREERALQTRALKRNQTLRLAINEAMNTKNGNTDFCPEVPDAPSPDPTDDLHDGISPKMAVRSGVARRLAGMEDVRKHACVAARSRTVVVMAPGKDITPRRSNPHLAAARTELAGLGLEHIQTMFLRAWQQGRSIVDQIVNHGKQAQECRVQIQQQLVARFRQEKHGRRDLHEDARRRSCFPNLSNNESIPCLVPSLWVCRNSFIPDFVTASEALEISWLLKRRNNLCQRLNGMVLPVSLASIWGRHNSNHDANNNVSLARVASQRLDPNVAKVKGGGANNGRTTAGAAPQRKKGRAEVNFSGCPDDDGTYTQRPSMTSRRDSGAASRRVSITSRRGSQAASRRDYIAAQPELLSQSRGDALTTARRASQAAASLLQSAVRSSQVSRSNSPAGSTRCGDEEFSIEATVQKLITLESEDTRLKRRLAEVLVNNMKVFARVTRRFGESTWVYKAENDYVWFLMNPYSMLLPLLQQSFNDLLPKGPTVLGRTTTQELKDLRDEFESIATDFKNEACMRERCCETNTEFDESMWYFRTTGPLGSLLTKFSLLYSGFKERLHFSCLLSPHDSLTDEAGISIISPAGGVDLEDKLFEAHVALRQELRCAEITCKLTVDALDRLSVGVQLLTQQKSKQALLIERLRELEEQTDRVSGVKVVKNELKERLTKIRYQIKLLQRQVVAKRSPATNSFALTIPEVKARFTGKAWGGGGGRAREDSGGVKRGGDSQVDVDQHYYERLRMARKEKAATKAMAEQVNLPLEKIRKKIREAGDAHRILEIRIGRKRNEYKKTIQKLTNDVNGPASSEMFLTTEQKQARNLRDIANLRHQLASVMKMRHFWDQRFTMWYDEVHAIFGGRVQRELKDPGRHDPKIGNANLLEALRQLARECGERNCNLIRTPIDPEKTSAQVSPIFQQAFQTLTEIDAMRHLSRNVRRMSTQAFTGQENFGDADLHRKLTILGSSMSSGIGDKGSDVEAIKHLQNSLISTSRSKGNQDLSDLSISGLSSGEFKANSALRGRQLHRSAMMEIHTRRKRGRTLCRAVLEGQAHSGGFEGCGGGGEEEGRRMSDGSDGKGLDDENDEDQLGQFHHRSSAKSEKSVDFLGTLHELLLRRASRQRQARSRQNKPETLCQNIDTLKRVRSRTMRRRCLSTEVDSADAKSTRVNMLKLFMTDVDQNMSAGSVRKTRFAERPEIISGARQRLSRVSPMAEETKEPIALETKQHTAPKQHLSVLSHRSRQQRLADGSTRLGRQLLPRLITDSILGASKVVRSMADPEDSTAGEGHSMLSVLRHSKTQPVRDPHLPSPRQHRIYRSRAFRSMTTDVARIGEIPERVEFVAEPSKSRTLLQRLAALPHLKEMQHELISPRSLHHELEEDSPLSILQLLRVFRKLILQRFGHVSKAFMWAVRSASAMRRVHFDRLAAELAIPAEGSRLIFECLSAGSGLESAAPSEKTLPSSEDVAMSHGHFIEALRNAKPLKSLIQLKLRLMRKFPNLATTLMSKCDAAMQLNQVAFAELCQEVGGEEREASRLFYQIAWHNELPLGPDEMPRVTLRALQLTLRHASGIGAAQLLSRRVHSRAEFALAMAGCGQSSAGDMTGIDQAVAGYKTILSVAGARFSSRRLNLAELVTAARPFGLPKSKVREIFRLSLIPGRTHVRIEEVALSVVGGFGFRRESLAMIINNLAGSMVQSPMQHVMQGRRRRLAPRQSRECRAVGRVNATLSKVGAEEHLRMGTSSEHPCSDPEPPAPSDSAEKALCMGANSGEDGGPEGSLVSGSNLSDISTGQTSPSDRFVVHKPRRRNMQGIFKVGLTTAGSEKVAYSVAQMRTRKVDKVAGHVGPRQPKQLLSSLPPADGASSKEHPVLLPSSRQDTVDQAINGPVPSVIAPQGNETELSSPSYTSTSTPTEMLGSLPRSTSALNMDGGTVDDLSRPASALERSSPGRMQSQVSKCCKDSCGSPSHNGAQGGGHRPARSRSQTRFVEITRTRSHNISASLHKNSTEPSPAGTIPEEPVHADRNDTQVGTGATTDGGCDDYSHQVCLDRAELHEALEVERHKRRSELFKGSNLELQLAMQRLQDFRVRLLGHFRTAGNAFDKFAGTRSQTISIADLPKKLGKLFALNPLDAERIQTVIASIDEVSELSYAAFLRVLRFASPVSSMLDFRKRLVQRYRRVPSAFRVLRLSDTADLDIGIFVRSVLGAGIVSSDAQRIFQVADAAQPGGPRGLLSARGLGFATEHAHVLAWLEALHARMLAKRRDIFSVIGTVGTTAGVVANQDEPLASPGCLEQALAEFGFPPNFAAATYAFLDLRNPHHVTLGALARVMHHAFGKDGGFGSCESTGESKCNRTLKSTAKLVSAVARHGGKSSLHHGGVAPEAAAGGHVSKMLNSMPKDAAASSPMASFRLMKLQTQKPKFVANAGSEPAHTPAAVAHARTHAKVTEAVKEEALVQLRCMRSQVISRFGNYQEAYDAFGKKSATEGITLEDWREAMPTFGHSDVDGWELTFGHIVGWQHTKWDSWYRGPEAKVTLAMLVESLEGVAPCQTPTAFRKLLQKRFGMIETFKKAWAHISGKEGADDVGPVQWQRTLQLLEVDALDAGHLLAALRSVPCAERGSDGGQQLSRAAFLSAMRCAEAVSKLLDVVWQLTSEQGAVPGAFELTAYPPDPLPAPAFEEQVARILPLTGPDARVLFAYLDVHNDGMVAVDDLLDTLTSMQASYLPFGSIRRMCSSAPIVANPGIASTSTAGSTTLLECNATGAGSAKGSVPKDSVEGRETLDSQVDEYIGEIVTRSTLGARIASAAGGPAATAGGGAKGSYRHGATSAGSRRCSRSISALSDSTMSPTFIKSGRRTSSSAYDGFQNASTALPDSDSDPLEDLSPNVSRPWTSMSTRMTGQQQQPSRFPSHSPTEVYHCGEAGHAPHASHRGNASLCELAIGTPSGRATAHSARSGRARCKGLSLHSHHRLLPHLDLAERQQRPNNDPTALALAGHRQVARTMESQGPKAFDIMRSVLDQVEMRHRAVAEDVGVHGAIAGPATGRKPPSFLAIAAASIEAQSQTLTCQGPRTPQPDDSSPLPWESSGGVPSMPLPAVDGAIRKFARGKETVRAPM